MTGAAGSDRQDARRRRARSAWWGYTLVAALVGVVTVAVVWVLGTTAAPVPRPVADPSVPALPLPTFAGTTQRPAAVAGRSVPSTSPSASPTSASPSPSSAKPAPDPSATASNRPAPTATRSATPDVVELTPLPPEEERDLRSVDGGADTTVEFVNRRGEQVTVYRLNQWGYRLRVARLAPGESHGRDTRVGHAFVVTDHEGDTLAVFQPVAAPGRAVVR